MTTTDTITITPPRGMRDLLPAQVALRDWASSIILQNYGLFGFTRIETPVMEHIHLLRGGEGGENLQLIYEVLKRGEKLESELKKDELSRNDLSDLGLRFDLTVPLVRYYSANENSLPKPLKAIQIGSVFRAEAPQKGRLRQFTQCDIDIIGTKSEFAEIELIQATTNALQALGFNSFAIHINDRRFLTALATHCGFAPERQSLVFNTLDKLDKIGMSKIREELQSEQHSPEAIDKMMQFLQTYVQAQEKGQTSFEEITSLLPKDLAGDFMESLQKIIGAVSSIAGDKFTIRFDPSLVRGMGYYTGAIFEIKYPGYSGSIAGGGRYDKMVGKFSKRDDVPACGFSIGFERVMDILSEKGFVPPFSAKKIAFIYDPDRDDSITVVQAANSLRDGQNVVSLQARKKDMKKQLDQILLQGFSEYVVFKGDPNNLEIKQLAAQK
jgi:histidyl-tRNA synthetase